MRRGTRGRGRGRGGTTKSNRSRGKTAKRAIDSQDDIGIPANVEEGGIDDIDPPGIDSAAPDAVASATADVAPDAAACITVGAAANSVLRESPSISTATDSNTIQRDNIEKGVHTGSIYRAFREPCMSGISMTLLR